MKNQEPNLQTNKVYDLEERTTLFSERMIDQCMGSAGSMGANYCEANEAESKMDFIHKIGICKKETKETKHWIRLLAHANPEFKEDFRKFWKEAEELLLIFSAIIRNTRNNKS